LIKNRSSTDFTIVPKPKKSFLFQSLRKQIKK
jgi:hypothetical protein